MSVEGMSDIFKAEAEAEKIIENAEKIAAALIEEAHLAAEQFIKTSIEAQIRDNALELEKIKMEAETSLKKEWNANEALFAEIQAKALLNLGAAVSLATERIVK